MKAGVQTRMILCAEHHLFLSSQPFLNPRLHEAARRCGQALRNRRHQRGSVQLDSLVKPSVDNVAFLRLNRIRYKKESHTDGENC